LGAEAGALGPPSAQSRKRADIVAGLVPAAPTSFALSLDAPQMERPANSILRTIASTSQRNQRPY
jgi:hypothetical protein